MATPTGMTVEMLNLIGLIERDHREIDARFATLRAHHDAATARSLCDALDRHAAGEELAIYPVVADELPNGRQMAGESEDEHAEARRLVAWVRRAEDPVEQARLVAELAIVVEEHVDAEESEVLPQIRAVFDDVRLASIAHEYEAAKRAWRGSVEALER
jgi:hemerythrin-like domain-containing protein